MADTDHKAIDEDWEWGVRSSIGVFPCRNRSHATGMMNSTSPVVGPMEGRKIVRRRRVQWEVAP